MGQILSAITPQQAEFIRAQPLYFVASAPRADDGHINLSPKGLDSFRLLNANSVAYLDLTGSGNETAAHVTENGRITLMFCGFGEQPGIVRLYGKGRVVRPGEPEWGQLRPLFSAFPGIRQIIHVQVQHTQTSCGFGVPQMDLVGQRDALPDWARRKGPEGVLDYQRRKNAFSIDGLPAPGIDTVEQP
ncbi:pyridoxamine 5'-phosphate oxidase family protein [Thioalkalivibrio sulfidiphilus]|uniref:Pyridoxamine 5'-phosphate oxidase-related FMN-binding n=1 Tax=Thioalkalivibrio sulfidiphilus (strain HL-EbGR7) TaxID=396588 RepID=B8GPS3_THISH|nr:pyridoxamine 5'-phosphate oxidase family protein [Thioalkalivibrio sulfidiphilus]ACL72240.1 pyridoxamine 5'-phosphate oxidase-related FMN-binding [Thioalkalivibrio sulfidiphilus HL-EbGr7]